MRCRDQKPDEPGWYVGREHGLDFFGQVAKVARVGSGLGLDSLFSGKKVAEGLRRRPKRGPPLRQVLLLVWGEGTMAAHMVENGTDQPNGRSGIVHDQLGQQAAVFAG